MPAQSAIAQLEKKAAKIVTLFFGVLLIGTLGYRVVSQSRSSWVDCVYMFKPKPTHRFATGDVLLAMTTAEELRKLSARCNA